MNCPEPRLEPGKSFDEIYNDELERESARANRSDLDYEPVNMVNYANNLLGCVSRFPRLVERRN